MVTWADVRRWDPAAVGKVADDLNAWVTRIIGANDDVEAMARFDGWTGDASVAASMRGNSLITSLEQLVAAASAVRRGAHETQIAVERITAYVRETEEHARHHGLMIVDSCVVPVPGTPPLAPEVLASRQRIQAEIADRVEQILRRAADVDADFALIMTRAMRGEISEQGVGTLAQAADVGASQSGLSIIGPPEGGTPSDVKAWWNSLSDTAQFALLQANPGFIGNLDGIPAEDRDAANRAVLAQEITRLQSDTSEEGKHKLQGLQAIDNRLNHPQPGQPQAFLLGLNTADDGKAIVSIGNPDKADNVATYVPGTGSDLGKISADMDRSDRMARSAAEAGSPSTAVIAWLGYDAPDELSNAASGDYADGGKNALAGFQDGLRATHEGDPSHSTVLGHSYGTTLVGYAARDGGLNADDLALVASPGVGVDNVSELHLDGVDSAQIGQHVHATVAENDIIKLANIEVDGIDLMHGPDPAAKEFGGHVFASDPGTEGPLGGVSDTAHSEYWNSRSKSLDNIGRIIAGKPTG